MSTERSRFHLAAMIWAALNLGVGCQAVGRDLLVDSGINPHVDASDDSRPILERLGLHVVGGTTPYVWTPPDPADPE